MITEENFESCIYYPPSSFGGKPCSTCNPEDPICSCYQRRVEVPPTNADRIRAMSDKELADFLGGIFTVERDCWGDYDPRLVIMQEPRVEVRCEEDIMNWLQSPADGGDENAM